MNTPTNQEKAALVALARCAQAQLDASQALASARDACERARRTPSDADVAVRLELVRDVLGASLVFRARQDRQPRIYLLVATGKAPIASLVKVGRTRAARAEGALLRAPAKEHERRNRSGNANRAGDGGRSRNTHAASALTS